MSLPRKWALLELPARPSRLVRFKTSHRLIFYGNKVTSKHFILPPFFWHALNNALARPKHGRRGNSHRSTHKESLPKTNHFHIPLNTLRHKFTRWSVRNPKLPFAQGTPVTLDAPPFHVSLRRHCCRWKRRCYDRLAARFADSLAERRKGRKREEAARSQRHDEPSARCARSIPLTVIFL